MSSYLILSYTLINRDTHCVDSLRPAMSSVIASSKCVVPIVHFQMSDRTREEKKNICRMRTEVYPSYNRIRSSAPRLTHLPTNSYSRVASTSRYQISAQDSKTSQKFLVADKMKTAPSRSHKERLLLVARRVEGRKKKGKKNIVDNGSRYKCNASVLLDAPESFVCI